LIAERPGIAKSPTASTKGVALLEPPLRGILGGL
jgi:hypothetical protein